MDEHYAIIGIAKIKTAGSMKTVLAHMTRSRPTANSNGLPNDILQKPKTLQEIMAEVESYRPRKNAVIGYDILLTASPGWFKGKTEEEIQAWEQASAEWLREKFGADSIMGIVAHRDETSPHVSAVCLPVVGGENGEHKLNARAITGGREKMRALWTEYAAAMKSFGMRRGKLYSAAEHKAIKDYYATVNEGKALASMQKVKAAGLPEPTLKERLDVRGYAAEQVNRQAAELMQENGNLQAALHREKLRAVKLEQKLTAYRRTGAAMKESPVKYQQMQEALEKQKRKTWAEYQRGVEAGKQEAEAELYLLKAENKGLRKSMNDMQHDMETQQRSYEDLVKSIKLFFRNCIPGNSTLRTAEAAQKYFRKFDELRDEIKYKPVILAGQKETEKSRQKTAHGFDRC